MCYAASTTATLRLVPRCCYRCCPPPATGYYSCHAAHYLLLTTPPLLVTRSLLSQAYIDKLHDSDIGELPLFAESVEDMDPELVQMFADLKAEGEAGMTPHQKAMQVRAAVAPPPQNRPRSPRPLTAARSAKTTATTASRTPPSAPARPRRGRCGRP